MTKPELIAERKKYGVNKVAMDYTMKIFETLDDNIVLIDGVKYQRMVNETPKPPTLYSIIAEWWCEDWTGDTNTICEDLLKRIEEWLPGEYQSYSEHNEGWNDCLQTIKENLK